MRQWGETEPETKREAEDEFGFHGDFYFGIFV
jgi:hypothetical protein